MEAIRKAETAADKLVEDAQNEAERVKKEAESAAADRIADARKKAAGRIAEAKTQAAAMGAQESEISEEEARKDVEALKALAAQKEEDAIQLVLDYMF